MTVTTAPVAPGPAGRGSAVLHNMSARPRTTVSGTVPVLRPGWTLFSWKRRLPELDPAMLARLDSWWQRFGLRGAVVMHPATETLISEVPMRTCADPDLTLNVLLRIRGLVLLAGMDLLDDPDALRGRPVATDDPRLTMAVTA